ncbi:MAG: homocysteine S-methyltransferase family protein [Candidatus Aureabacteria bacterium]|nr:homocysteine S-methyltransferase family protein [Candidatus Auribacterota bacterium]
MKFDKLLKSGKKLICDGAMGTQLIERGLGAGECPELWNIEKPEMIKAIHSAYIEAGAQMIITNTFGGNLPKLKNYNLQDKADVINRKAVEIALAASSGRAAVLGGIGPTGQFLEPLGTYSKEEFREIFHRQSKSLADAGAEAIIIETMTDVNELAAAVEAAVSTKLPVAASMSFAKDINRDDYHTIMGVDVKTFVNRAEECGAGIICVNCGTGPQDILKIVERIIALTSLPVMAEPNAGLPQYKNGQTFYRQSPEEFASEAALIFKAGALIVGGCCGTTPEHIRKLSVLLNK